jgi:hypothetical protein
VDLPVDGLHLSVAPDVDARVGGFLAVGDPLDDRTRDQIDPELTRGLPRPRDAGAVERLGACGELLGAAEYAPLLRQHHQLGPTRRGLANEPVSGRKVAIGVLGGVQLNGAGTHGRSLSSVG